ncbi:hypothetical protein H0I23_15505 [Cellulophaga sp. HaHaR_3_176]|nr:hypothetical protein [Cellulophaga sp. HaHaR_3_176]QWX83838.1 hypothetical protein H0I23_15505 [Cellulophaga sp. HaHaR_3_176]
MIQNILMYLTLAVAIGYVVKKYFLPKKLSAIKKQNQKACGSTDCGCH